MKARNIIAESLDLTTVQGQFVTLKKNYDAMNKAIEANPDLAKAYALQINNMNASVSGLDKLLSTMSAQQKAEANAALKQQTANQVNSAKPGTTQPLANQGTTAGVKPPANVVQPVATTTPPLAPR